MKNKVLIYAGIGLVVLILAGSYFAGRWTGNGDVVKDLDVDDVDLGEDLSEYRSEDIPEDCRLPDYEDDLDWWRQHLSHHKETLYCLDYYE